MTHKLVIFDWDGTLMDSQAKIVKCMQLAAQHCHLPEPSNEQVKHIIGISLLPAIQQLFGLTDNANDLAIAETIRDAYKNVYLQQDQTPCPLFNGVPQLLESLDKRKVKMAVATGKARRGLQRAWDNTGTEHYFVASRTADEAESKPSADMLVQLLTQIKVDASEAIMVGDTSYDMQMAKQLGMPSIAVSYGVHDEQQLKSQSPSFIVHSVTELQAVLLEQLC